MRELWKYHGSTASCAPAGNTTPDEQRSNDLEEIQAKRDSLSKVLDTLCHSFKFSETKGNIKPSLSEFNRKSVSVDDEKFQKPNLASSPSKSKIGVENDKENKNSYNVPSNNSVVSQTTSSKAKKKVGRKPMKKSKAADREPLIKKEVVQRKHRAETVYTLRKNIKKVKFMDEVSEPSDLDEDEHDELSSLSDSDEYKPDNELKKGMENEEVDSEDEDISDENEEDFDEDEIMPNKYEHADSDEEDLFSIENGNEYNAVEVECLSSEAAISIKDIENLANQETSELPEAMTMFTVKVCPDGTVEVLNQEEASKPLDPGYETAIALVGPSKGEENKGEPKETAADSPPKDTKMNYKRKIADEHGNVIGYGRVVQMMEGEKGLEIEHLHKKLTSSSEKHMINPRSLLKSKPTVTSEGNKTVNKHDVIPPEPEPKVLQGSSPSRHSQQVDSSSKTSSLILFCSVCGYQCGSEGKSGGQQALRYHAASKHPGSRFFLLPVGNPHRDCVQCSILMNSYEKLIATDPNISLKGM